MLRRSDLNKNSCTPQKMENEIKVSENENLRDISRDNVYFRLKNPKQKSKLLDIIFDEGIPYTSHLSDIYSSSNKIVNYLESQGFYFDIIDSIDIGNLSLKERNEIKERCLSQLREKKDQLIRKLSKKYGIKYARR
ncbi:MAG: hypothetical protein L6266_01185 [Nanoarchaeota archaeon]|nr:hypothetical protein [Nanoarchaeota archaeon]